jgi:Zn-dependent metalloprotease
LKIRERVLKAGITQEQFQQYYNGIPVKGGNVNVYTRDGIAIKANGKIIHDLNIPSAPAVDENQALDAALVFLGHNDYAWEDQKLMDRFGRKSKLKGKSLIPQGKLEIMFSTESQGRGSDAYALCWKFDIVYTRSGEYTVYVNALTGGIHNMIKMDRQCSPVAATTPYNGIKQIYTSAQGNCSPANVHELVDNCALYIEVLNDDANALSDHICAPGSTNNWTNSISHELDGIQVLWGMRQVSNYFALYHNWNSYDNSGGSVDCYVMVEYEDDAGNPIGTNASYSSFWEDFDFGYGLTRSDETDSYTTLDICGHEFTHGVVDFSSNLVYQNESGALNESFADIFGETIDKYVTNTVTDTTWLLADEMANLNTIRNMKHPDWHSDPDTYLGTHWYSGTDNSKLVHTNSGVQNFMYVLLCEGGSGVNDNGTNYNVNGIGLYDAHDIAFLALNYLWFGANYLDSRDAWIEAAIDLYGSCSNQAIQTGNAWHAVGVGSQGPFYSNMVTGTQTGVAGTLTREAINHVFTAGTTTINSVSSASTMVRFLSAYEVTLSPGFVAASGTHFQARINACSVTLHTSPRVTGTSDQTAGNDLRVEDVKLRAFPNPFKDQITVEIELQYNSDEASIRIFDLAGRNVENPVTRSLNAGKNLLEINTSGLPSGVYLLNITLQNGKSLQQRIIKQE